MKFHLVPLGMVAASCGCIVQTESVGANPSAIDAAALSELQDQVALLQDSVANLEKQNTDLQDAIKSLETHASNPDCPRGYDDVAKPLVPANPDSVLCQKGDDQIVKVGVGLGTFWVDRFEASIWDGASQRFATKDDSALGFTKSGQASKPWIAKSVHGVLPSRFVTWFQAAAACRANGKRLLTAEEWFQAGRGTHDPTSDNDGSRNTMCNTDAFAARNTGSAGDPLNSPQDASCYSDWGAEDIIGNVWEWTTEWQASVARLDLTYNGMSVSEPVVEEQVPWPDVDLYGQDATYGILSAPSNGEDLHRGMPSGVIRGGSFTYGTRAGLYTVSVQAGISYAGPYIGFRCIVGK